MKEEFVPRKGKMYQLLIKKRRQLKKEYIRHSKSASVFFV